MSFEILEYPLKQWIIELIDDKKIKSDVFDLLGEPDFDIRYSSDMLYNIDDLVEHEKHNLIITIIPIKITILVKKYEINNVLERCGF